MIEEGADIKTISHRIQVQHQLKGSEYWESVKKSNPIYSQVYGRDSTQPYVDRSKSTEPPIHTLIHDLRPHHSTQFKIPEKPSFNGDATRQLLSQASPGSFQNPFKSPIQSQPSCTITKYEPNAPGPSLLDILGNKRTQSQISQNSGFDSQPSQIIPPSKISRNFQNQQTVKVKID